MVLILLVVALLIPRVGSIGYDRTVALHAYRRISALNYDYNLPLEEGDLFGTSVTALARVRYGDDTIELAIGAPGDSSVMKSQGAVYLLSLNRRESTTQAS